MPWNRSTPIVVSVVGLALLSHRPAHAEVFRSTVIVERPVGLASMLATNLRVDEASRQALIERYLRERLSAVLLQRREPEVRTALEPLGTLLNGFKVVTRAELPGTNQVRVVCEADVDTADVVRRLVESRVISFGDRPPRMLLLPAPGTPPDLLRTLRARMSDTMRGAGITVLADETVVSPVQARGGAYDRIGVSKAGVDSGAQFVAITTVSAAPPLASQGLVALDVTIRYTLLRVYDAAVVAEGIFSQRGGGGSQEAAMQRAIEEMAPLVARGLAGRVAEAVFSNGHVVDLSQQPGMVTINVKRRPNAAATTAFLSFLRERGFRAALGPGRQAPGEGVPAERVVIEGRASVEELYSLFAITRFGEAQALSASVFEHGSDSLGVEILDGSTAPEHQPVALASIEFSVRQAAASESRLEPRGVAGPPPSPGPVEGRGRGQPPTNPERLKTGAGIVTQTGTRASTPTPLEFEFSQAFEVATTAGKAR